MSGYIEVPQGDGLDPEQFLPILEPQKPEDLSQEEDPQATKKVPKRQGDKILEEAKERFKLCAAWEALTRKRNLEDLKFVEADSENGFQWPNDVRKAREVDKRPALTINKTRQHCLMIINDAKQNKPTIKIKATGGGATYQAAQVLESIVRSIEYHSNASSAYDSATESQVKMGIGYWRVVTDYVADDSFDQEIFIRRVRDPFSVYIDPDINEVDGSDASYAFIFQDMPVDEFNRSYPNLKGKVGRSNTGLDEGNDWVDDKHVRRAEYFRRLEREEELISFVDPSSNERKVVKASDLSPEIVDMVKNDPMTRTRMASTYDVEWFLIVGSMVLETKIWPGKYIPIVRVIGEETIIDKELDRKGHVRALKDPQRVYNYWSSSAVENVALQSKTPYIASAESIEGFENQYGNANQINYSVLPYNAYDDQGRPLQPPKRQEPVSMPQAYITGLQISSSEMMAVSGQYEPTLGEQGDEKTGIAIQERQRTGNKATFHYIDNLAVAIRFTGKILIDLIPKIYDTPRMIRILGEDGTESQIQIDPTQQQALAESRKPSQREMDKQVAITQILNPNVGRYEVQSDVGPNYATKRQEAFNSFTQIISTRPELVQIIGDILMKAGDFPMADEAAERLKRMVPKQALGEGPDPETQILMEQVEGLKQSLAAALQALADKTGETKVSQEKVAVDTFKAETDRMQTMIDLVDKALARAADPAAMADAVRKVLLDTLGDEGSNIPDLIQGYQNMAPPDQGIDQPNSLAQPMGNPGEATPRDIQPSPDDTPIEGMRRAPDGKYYLPDPERPGKYLEVLGTT
jgi:hypothetical protein